MGLLALRITAGDDPEPTIVYRNPIPLRHHQNLTGAIPMFRTVDRQLAALAFWVLILPILLAGQAGAESEELLYRGEFVQKGPQGDIPVRTFALHAIRHSNPKETQILSWIEIEAKGGTPWQRLGYSRTNEVANKNEHSQSVPAELRHQFDGRGYVILLPDLRLQPGFPLEAGADWEHDGLTFEVTRSRRFANRECWEINVRGGNSHGEQLIIDKQSLIVVKTTRRIVLGRGDLFSLVLTLEKSEPLAEGDEEYVAPLLLAIAPILQDQRPATPTAEATITDEDLKEIGTIANDLNPIVAKTPWKRFVEATLAEVASQQQRAKSFDELRTRYLGKATPKFDLKDLNGKPLTRDEDAGKVTVLHFWTYLDVPLEEPYGQVGYLEFLHSRREKDAVAIYGVAVDERFGEEETRASARRAVTAFRKQLNPTYTITSDAGELLKNFGNPTELGSPLPLWVVIGKDGTILEYHSGHYDVDPRVGLKKLDAVIDEALK